MATKTIKQITTTQTTVNETDWFELQENTSETSKKVQASSFGVPVGTIIMYAKSTAPTSYLNCDGSEISRTTYSILYGVIGTTYGVGDGSTTFNLPNYCAVSPKGIGNQTINTRVKTGPAALGSIIEDTMQGHRFPPLTDSKSFVNSPSVGGGANFQAGQSPLGVGNLDATTGDPVTDGTNGDPRTGVQTQDCTIGTNFCIKYQ